MRSCRVSNLQWIIIVAMAALVFSGGVLLEYRFLVSKRIQRAPLVRSWLSQESKAHLPSATNQLGVPAEYVGRLSIILLCGQSNMSGRGPLSKSTQKTNSRAFVFGNDYRWRIASEPIDREDGQVDEVSLDPGAGVGPWLAFANRLLQLDPELVIGLVP